MSAKTPSMQDRRRYGAPAAMLVALVGASCGLALEAAAASRVLPYREISPVAAAASSARPHEAPTRATSMAAGAP